MRFDLRVLDVTVGAIDVDACSPRCPATVTINQEDQMRREISKANRMRSIVTMAGALLVLTIFLMIWASDAAQAGRYCLSTREFRSCGFSTWHQCQAARHGQGGVCSRKPGA
jgi:hypothetical protein